MAVLTGALPNTVEGCMAERLNLIKDQRRNLEDKKARGVSVSDGDIEENKQIVARCSSLKEKIGRLSTTHDSLMSMLGDEQDPPVRKTSRRQNRGSARNLRSPKFAWKNLYGNSRNVLYDKSEGLLSSSGELIDSGDPYYLEAVQNYLKTNKFKNAAETFRVHDDSRAGTFVMPDVMAAGILKEVDNSTFMVGLSTVTTVQGNPRLGFRKRLTKADSYNWGSEISDATDNTEDTLSYGQIFMTPHIVTSALRFSRSLVANTGVDIIGMVKGEVAIDLTEFMENTFLLGDGVNKPLGIMVPSPSGIPASRDVSTGSSATVFTFDSLIRLKYSLNSAYRSKARLVLHPDRVADLALKRTEEGGANTGSYLWNPSRVTGEPDQVVGMPIEESYFMPNATGTGNYWGIYGDFSHYRILISSEQYLQTVYELYARTNEIGIFHRLSFDGKPIMGSAFSRGAYGA